MGLLAPWFLAGAAAVGLPVYLHLLRRSSTIPKPFSSLMFFEPRTQSSIYHRRLRFFLLLSLRVALLVLLALAFANPFVNRLAARAVSDTLVLLVVDNSFSMRAGSRLDDAKQEAASVLSARRGTEHLQIMSLDAQLHVLTQPTEDSATARAVLADIRPSDSRGSFGELVRAVRLMADSAHGPIVLHLFSDLQRSNMAASVADMILPDNVTLVLHPTTKTAVPNWTVERVNAPAQLFGPAKDGKQPRVQAVIAGYGTPAATRTASLVVNGKTVATASVQVPASGRASVEFPSLSVPYGFSRCEVRIDSADALPVDDAYLFAVERSDPLRALFVHAASDTRSPRYFSDALASAAESAFTLQSVTTEQAADLPLSKYAFVVVSNVTALSSSFEGDLLKYVRGGGSVWIALGRSAEGRSRVPVFGDAIEGVHNYAREFSSGQERFLRIGDTDPSHASVSAGNLSGVKFYYVVRVDAANSRVVARLTDHTPVVLDKKIGEGRVLVFASGLDNDTNDFPLQPVFVAFVEQTARYLSGAGRTMSASQVDALVELRTADEQGSDRELGVEVVDPEGHRPLSLKEAATAQSFKLSRAGFYQMRLASGRQVVVGVNPDRRESNLDVMPADMQAIWRGAPRTAQASIAVGGQAAEQTEPRSLWWYIMILVLVAALSESCLASRYLDTPLE